MPVDAWLEVKEQVRQATDIVDLLGSYLPLQRRGREYLGLCPFHDDTRPSMHVNPERQIYKCFVCDSGGDVFSFVMQRESVEFREALELLADRAAISLPTASRSPSPPSGADDKRVLYAALAWAEKTYHEYLLRSPEAESARRYLEQRQVSAESIRRFRIGFSPNRWDFLLSKASTTSFAPLILERVGLVARRSSGDGFYDRFRGRLLFPIREPHAADGRAVAFGGRILPELAADEVAKYINSPETPLFSKHRQFYGLDLARDAISSAREAIVVEGYTDCVAAHQAGVGNVIAVLGTALGETHIQLMRRFADKIVLVLDGDEAGQRRTNEILKLFVAAQVDLRILTLPQGVDPCDFLQAQGGEAFGRLVAGAADALEHQIRTATQGLDITADTHRANEALEEILGTLARAPRLATTTASAMRLREHQVLARLSRQFGPPEEELRRRLAELRSSRRSSSPAESAEQADEQYSPAALDFWDRELLELVISHPEHLPAISAVIEPGEMRGRVARRIFQKCLEIYEAGGRCDFARLMLEAEDPKIKRLLIGLDEQAQAKSGSNPAGRLTDILLSFQRRREDAEHHQMIADLRSESRPDAADLLGQALEALRPRHRREEPMEG